MTRSGSLCAMLSAATLSASLMAAEVSVAQTARQPDTLTDTATLKDLFQRVSRCWRSPELPNGDSGMQITVLVAFNRNGEILGQPRITYESENTSDDDRLVYRKAVMETFQRCTPFSFSNGLAGAIAGRPITFRFDDRRKPPKPKERYTWLMQKTL